MIVLHGLNKMAVGPHVFAALLVLGVQQCFCQVPSVITITPSSPTISANQSQATGVSVTVSCRPPSSVFTKVFNLNIRRVKYGSTADPEVLAVVVLLSTPPGPTTTLPGATVSGSIEDGGSRSLTLTMPEANCDDGGMLMCTATVLADGGIFATHSSTANLTIEVLPGLITLTPTPSGTTTWVVNNTLTMLCNGIVGTADDASRIEWHWDYNDIGSQGFLGTWRSYDGPASDIVTGNLVTAGNCYKRQSSTLTRNLQIEDTGRTYRCWLKNLDMNKDNSGMAQEIAVGTVTATGNQGGSSGSSGGDSGGSTTPAKADVGAIVGGLIGGLIVIAIIVVIIFFVMRRRKAKKNAEYTSDKPADEAVPPYTTSADPSPAYALPNRHKSKNKGESNKAMDDYPDEKSPPRAYPDDKSPPRAAYPEDKPRRYEPKPARYENSRYNDNDYNPNPTGRSNRAYDDDRYSNRHYSSDDGGTDSRLNTSMHSLHSRGTGDPSIGTAI